MMKRTVILGLDGVPFGLLKDFADKNIMPNTKEIISKGIFKKMQSSIPEVSSVAWASLITGNNPAEHGIFGFTDFRPNSYELKFPNFNDLNLPPFWNSIEGKSIIVNVPSTYPVRRLNGVHISGFVSVELEKSVYPLSLIPKLKELDYRLDVDSQLAHKSLDLFLEDLSKTLMARVQTYRFLWDYVNWQLFMFVFTGTDRLMHFLWDACEDDRHKYHSDFLNHFRRIDEIIGEINSKIGDNDLLIILSDHGFERLDKNIYINYLLKREGFLKLQDAGEAGWSHIDYSAKAFALEPARIYLHLKNKYSRGRVESEDREKILRDLEELLYSLEIDNKKVVRDIFRKEAIYAGSLLERAPDLILVGNKGFNLKAAINADKLDDKGIFNGKHTQDDAFLLVNRMVKIPENLTVSDVVGIIKEGWL